ncbi:MAG: type II toxin-antitoxin system prevent-host-death family antitoxin [Acidobacteria bacterium]|nr:type II toxin-antitoxin system prevent-host-death family antitoxin [Acidobacteriota bacterium]
MATTSTSVVQLKSRLSEYLRRVKAGGELVITERGVPVAKLVPLDATERRTTRRLRLSKSGVVRAGRGKLPKVLQTPPQGSAAGVLEALLAERGDPTSDR